MLTFFFLGKKKKNHIGLSSAEFAQGVIKLKKEIIADLILSECVYEQWPRIEHYSIFKLLQMDLINLDDHHVKNIISYKSVCTNI